MIKTIAALNSLVNTCKEIESNGAVRFNIQLRYSIELIPNENGEIHEAMPYLYVYFAFEGFERRDFSTPDLAPESIKILDFYLREVVLKNLIEEGKKTTQK